MRRNGVLLSVLLSSGCALVSEDSTIGSLRPDTKTIQDVAIPRLMHHQVREEYQALLPLLEENEKLHKAVERRIADIHMMEADYLLVQGEAPPSDGYYADAIDAYNAVLEKYPFDAENAEVVYQLAKAYELQADDERALEALATIAERYPRSRRLGEVHFRKGDIHFKRQEYELAEREYSAVVGIGPDSRFFNNALYLLGWCRYKQSDYEQAMIAFNRVLDSIIPADGKLKGLSKADHSLAEDTLRIMSLSLSYGGGAEALKSLYAGRKQPRYAWLLYSGLGTLFLEKERYEDSAATYRVFVEQAPTSDFAPEMHSRMIRAYIDGDFPQQILPEKESYVSQYGVHSKFWRVKSAEARQQVMPTLQSYLDELARHYHGTGQKLAKKNRSKDRAEQQQAFSKAAGYYRQYVDTFPGDAKVTEMVFMGAEASFDGENYTQAIALYERSAYELGDRKYGADAGYATIIAYQKHAEKLKAQHGADSVELTAWQGRSVESKLQFVRNYGEDERSSAVMASASEELIALQQYQRAMTVANEVLEQPGAIDRNLSKTAYGVIARGHYEQGNLAEAERAYVSQASFSDDDSEKQKIRENIAAVAYKQSSAASEQGDMQAAIDHLLRIKRLAPSSDARVVAQYDAASHLISLEQYAQAIVELSELQRKFPDHKLASSIPAKLAYAYEKDGHAGEAADQYWSIYRNSKDPGEQRDALFSAAELNKQAGNTDLAIEQFRNWAHKYEQPFDNRMEARYNLAVLYKQKKDMNRHLYWLRRIIEADKKAGRGATDRSGYLAAWANAQYGDYWTWEFDNVRLKAPLEKHLARKQEKLMNAQQRYQQAASYGVLEFTTKASYSIADLYARFSRQIMDSPKPRGLSGAQLAEYDMLLEEQAIPFEELAIELHQNNIQRAWEGNFNPWIERSYAAMSVINPIRFDKSEMRVAYGQGLR